MNIVLNAMRANIILLRFMFVCKNRFAMLTEMISYKYDMSILNIKMYYYKSVSYMCNVKLNILNRLHD
jgi:hypothetical protein